MEAPNKTPTEFELDGLFGGETSPSFELPEPSCGEPPQLGFFSEASLGRYISFLEC